MSIGSSRPMEAPAPYLYQLLLFPASLPATQKRVTTPDRTMTVCDICGVFINSMDADDKKWVRRANSVQGKQCAGQPCRGEEFCGKFFGP